MSVSSKRVTMLDRLAKQIAHDFVERFYIDAHDALRGFGCLYYRNTAHPMGLWNHTPFVEENDEFFNLDTQGYFTIVGEKLIDDSHYLRFIAGIIPDIGWLLATIHLEKKVFQEQDGMDPEQPINVGIEQAMKVEIRKVELGDILKITGCPIELIGNWVGRLIRIMIDNIEAKKNLTSDCPDNDAKKYWDIIRKMRKHHLFKTGVYFRSIRYEN